MSDHPGAGTDSTVLSLRTAVSLAHVLVAQVAAAVGVRALAIKGPVAELFGLRSERVSADVDVIIDPAGLEHLRQGLLQRGWHSPVERAVPRVLAPHSITLVHDEWPCAIDIHYSFPGLLADACSVFDRFWKGRTVVSIAHGEVLAPSRAGMAVVLALHSLRSPADPRSQKEFPVLLEAIESTFSVAEREELVRIVVEGRAQWVMRDVMAIVAAGDAGDDASPEEKAVWQLNQLAPGEKSAFLWRREAKAALGGGQLSRIWRAIWVRRADVPRSFVSQVPTRREHWKYQTERWRRGVRALFARQGRR